MYFVCTSFFHPNHEHCLALGLKSPVCRFASHCFIFIQEPHIYVHGYVFEPLVKFELEETLNK